MKEKVSTFQIILFVVLGFAILIGVLMFSFQRSKSSNQTANVSLWGTVPSELILSLTDKINEAKRDAINMTYTEFSPTDFEQKLIEALASGTGPDMVVFNNDLVIKHENKLATITYEFYPQKTFKDTFVDAGDVLLKNDGITGFPWMIDPLVMYYNRTILNNEGIAVPPKYWDEFISLVPTLVTKDSTFNISQSAVSFGEFRNVKNAREIFMTLVMQAGNPLITRNVSPADTFERTEFISLFSERLGFNLVPAEAALTFFTQFSNPAKLSYSWNRSLPNSEEMFLSGELAFYFGRASEYRDLQRKNPNLNFDATLMPQSRATDKKVVYADLNFIGLVKSSPNLQSAFNAAFLLTNYDNIAALSEITALPPVRSDLLTNKNDNAVLQSFYSSALIAQPFLDPSVPDTTRILTNMVESVVSGSLGESEAVTRAGSEIKKYLK
jgi:ABC-type glycerol-3-phosphate transport system substrate-binding protein